MRSSGPLDNFPKDCSFLERDYGTGGHEHELTSGRDGEFLRVNLPILAELLSRHSVPRYGPSLVEVAILREDAPLVEVANEDGDPASTHVSEPSRSRKFEPDGNPSSPDCSNDDAIPPQGSTSGGISLFRKDAAFFDICFRTEKGKIPSSLLGAQYAFALFEQPNVPIEACVLRQSTKWQNTSTTDRQDNYDAMQKCRVELVDIKSDLDDEGLQEIERRELEEEMEKIKREIRRLSGLGGKPRTSTSGDASEKDRLAVYGCLKTFYDNCRQKYDMPGLASHFQGAIKTEGTCYVYRPIFGNSENPTS